MPSSPHVYSDNEDSRSEDEDSVGSLIDFIVDDDEDEEEEEDEEEDEYDFGDGGMVVEEPDDVGEDGAVVTEIRQQYQTSMEEEGIVKNERGLFRSRRSTQGKPPDRYVSENHSTMLLDDVGSEVEFVFSGSDSECSVVDDDEDDDYIDEEE